LKTLTLDIAIHREAQVVLIKFPRGYELEETVRKIKDVRWTKTFSAWYAPYSIAVLNQIKTVFGSLCTIDATALKEKIVLQKNKTNSATPQLSDEAKLKMKQFKEWLKSKRYSDSTITTYLDALKAFLKFYCKKSVAEINNEDVIIFNNEFVLKYKLSPSYQNQVVNAIKLFFSTVQNTTIHIEKIHRPKRVKLLPNVLSKEEVKLILYAHNNIKHKAMLSLIYSCGLRCGELLQLKPEHIDSKRSVLIIKQAKGRKDRIAPLSSKIVELLREYFAACKPRLYLFEGQTKGQPYDSRSLQQVLKQALEKTKINKPVTLHWLRHSYATHLLENGTDLRYIQEILGHSSSKTTEIYTHVSTKNIQKIVSPFDYL